MNSLKAVIDPTTLSRVDLNKEFSGPGSRSYFVEIRYKGSDHVDQYDFGSNLEEATEFIDALQRGMPNNVCLDRLEDQ